MIPSIIITIVIFDIIVVFAAIAADKITDSKSSTDAYFDDILVEFEKNKIELDQIDINSFKLGSGHLYE